MATKIFTSLAKAIVDKGERQSIDTERVITMSELTLIVSVASGKAVPRAIIFPLFGMDFVMLADGTVSFADPDESDDYLDLTSSRIATTVQKFLTWRLTSLEELSI
jgi:hypothetical protein